MSLASPTLDPSAYRDLVQRALAEDSARGDVTTNAIVGPADRARGTFVAKSPLTLAGAQIAVETFRQLDSDILATWNRSDGDDCEPGSIIGEISGTARALLSGERTALNFLQHLSGVATLARRFVRAAGGAITILDTRKTIPLFRALEKYAVRVGGATNHRMSLSDGILIKDNHLRLAGSIADAVSRVRSSGSSLPIEVEVETLEQVDEAIAAGTDILLLDNMTLDKMREAVKRACGKTRTEISGGVTLERIQALSTTGADSASSGALTHSAPAVDISFEIERA
jgi:nicotinate-nucleotide pyrophosphorylase (carboxylating)